MLIVVERRETFHYYYPMGVHPPGDLTVTIERPVSNHIGLLVFDFYRKTEEKSMAEILEKVLVEVMKAVGKGVAKIIVWTAHQIEKK